MASQNININMPRSKRIFLTEEDFGDYIYFRLMDRDSLPRDLTELVPMLKVWRSSKKPCLYKVAEVVDTQNGILRCVIEKNELSVGVFNANIILENKGRSKIKSEKSEKFLLVVQE